MAENVSVRSMFVFPFVIYFVMKSRAGLDVRRRPATVTSLE
jgi:hypothetical protein